MKRYTVRGAALLLAGFAPLASATSFDYAQTAGFGALVRNQATAFDFEGAGDLSITRLSSLAAGAAGAGIFAGRATASFSASAPANPAFIAGDRHFFQLEYHDANGPGSTVSYRFSFAQGLSTSSYLVFADLDFREEVSIKARDLNGNLIPFSKISFLQHNGNDPQGATAAYVAWTSLLGYTGKLANTLVEGRDDPVVSLQAAEVIGSLEFDFELDPANTVSNNSIRFNFARPLPEPADNNSTTPPAEEAVNEEIDQLLEEVPDAALDTPSGGELIEVVQNVIDLPGDAMLEGPDGPVSGDEIKRTVVDLLQDLSSPNLDARQVANRLLLEPLARIPASEAATRARDPFANPDVVVDANAMVGRMAMLRLMQLRDGGLGEAAARSAGGEASAVDDAWFGAPLNGPTPDEKTRVWGRGFGAYQQVDAMKAGEDEYTAAFGAPVIGADWMLGQRGILGVFAGAGVGHVGIDRRYASQQESLTSGLFGVYGSLAPAAGRYYAQGFALGSYNGIERERQIATPVLQRLAESDNDAWSMALSAEAGMNLHPTPRSTVQPYVGIGWSKYWADPYRESGAGSLDLQVDAQTAHRWTPTAGVRLMRACRVGQNELTPFLGAAFLAQLADGSRAPGYRSDFLGLQTAQIGTDGRNRYGASVQAGLELARVDGITGYITFDGAWLDEKSQYGGQVGIQIPF